MMKQNKEIMESKKQFGNCSIDSHNQFMPQKISVRLPDIPNRRIGGIKRNSTKKDFATQMSLDMTAQKYKAKTSCKQNPGKILKRSQSQMNSAAINTQEYNSRNFNRKNIFIMKKQKKLQTFTETIDSLVSKLRIQEMSEKQIQISNKQMEKQSVYYNEQLAKMLKAVKINRFKQKNTSKYKNLEDAQKNNQKILHISGKELENLNKREQQLNNLQQDYLTAQIIKFQNKLKNQQEQIKCLQKKIHSDSKLFTNNNDIGTTFNQIFKQIGQVKQKQRKNQKKQKLLNAKLEITSKKLRNIKQKTALNSRGLKIQKNVQIQKQTLLTQKQQVQKMKQIVQRKVNSKNMEVQLLKNQIKNLICQIRLFQEQINKQDKLIEEKFQKISGNTKQQSKFFRKIKYFCNRTKIGNNLSNKSMDKIIEDQNESSKETTMNLKTQPSIRL